MCFSYLDIHFKQHLNQAFLDGPHPLLIKSQTAQDKLICLRNGGDINRRLTTGVAPSVVRIKPIQHFIIPELSGESVRTVSLYLFFSPEFCSLLLSVAHDTSILVADKSIINMRGVPVSCR